MGNFRGSFTGLFVGNARGLDRLGPFLDLALHEVAEIFRAHAIVGNELGAERFEPLAHIADDAICVLGLVTTKTSRRETVAELAGRIQEAARVVPLERLALSPQCGFSTSVLGNSLSLEDERAKLATIAETAAEVWR